MQMCMSMLCTGNRYVLPVCRSKLLNSCVPDSLDERALNLPADASSQLARREALQNNALCINAAKALGCSLADVTPEDIFEGKVRLF